MRQGRVGKSLDSIEAEAKEKAKQVYDIEETEINGAAEKRIGRVNAKYDAMIDNASDEAREAWGLSNPLDVAVEEKPETNYHENLSSMVGDFDKRINEGVRK